MENKKMYSFLFAGVLLQGFCILGSCIASAGVYETYKFLFIPNILSYILISIGIFQEINLLNIQKKKR